jgi:thiol-disulfide isomerase/thioredoxin
MLFEDFQNNINVNKPVIIMFFANWCILSLKLKNIFIDMLKNNNNITSLVIDIDESIDVRNYCKIFSSCIIQVYYKNKFVNEYFFSSKEDLMKIINDVLCVALNDDIILPCVAQNNNNNGLCVAQTKNTILPCVAQNNNNNGLCVAQTKNTIISKNNNDIILPKINNKILII